jgi:hypothetical protein
MKIRNSMVLFFVDLLRGAREEKNGLRKTTLRGRRLFLISVIKEVIDTWK